MPASPSADIDLEPALRLPPAEEPAERVAGKAAPARLIVARRVLLGVVLALSAVLQFYRLGDWQFFSDDQAAELNVMHGLLVDHHLPLLGMSLAVGRAHLGPLFYYLLALPLWLGQLDPTAGVALLGLFQVATVYLLYRIFVLVEAPWAGLCAAALYATSGLVVYWSRFLWPNCAPFFVLLVLYALLGLARGEGRYLVPLAGGLAVAAQLQPTAALLAPVAALWLLLYRPRVAPRLVLAALGVTAVLFAPSIVYELTHGFAETRAWIGYITTVRPGHGLTGGLAHKGLGHGFATLETFGWRLLGLRARGWADLLLGLSLLALIAVALRRSGRHSTTLARLLLLWGAVYWLAFSLYHETLYPHFVEPLYPLPFLAMGLLIDLVVSPTQWTEPLWAAPRAWPILRAPRSWLARVIRLSPFWAVPGARGVRTRAWTWRAPAYLATAAVVVGLAAVNVGHLWADHFALDAYQLDSPAQAQGNEIALGAMRRVVTLVQRDAAGRPYSLLLAVRDGAGGGYLYLLRQADNPPAATLRPLQYLLVEPADRPAWLWPLATRNRWRLAPGGVVLWPHLLLWRLLTGPVAPARQTVAWDKGTAALDGPVTTLAALPGAGRLLAGFIGGAAESWDGGRSWRRARWPRPAPNGLSVIAGFAWSAACPRRLYAGTFDGVVVSTDGGASWGRLKAQPASTEILALLADPRRCGALLAGTRDGVAVTRDGGRSWSVRVTGGPPDPAVHALAYGAGGAVYAGTTAGLWISHDGGRAWVRPARSAEPRPILSLLIDPGGSGQLIAGTGAGVASAGLDGTAWATTGSGLGATIYALAAGERPGTLLAGTDAGLYRLHNSSGVWTRLALPPDATVSALARAGGLLYAATNEGVYRSTDDGHSWARP